VTRDASVARRASTLAARRLIVALDDTELAPTVAMARRLRGLARTLKVGSILFTACGPEMIRRVRALGFEVMLDLKFHDIPSTVELSCRSAVRHRISLLTVHGSGEEAMLAAAVRGCRLEARRRGLPRPRVLAVTVLTSVASDGIAAKTMRMAAKAQRAGCDGVVTSAREAPALRRRFGRTMLIVCPGIRPAHAAAYDQRRVATPAHALERGADCLVVGRPITSAPDPRRAAVRILEEMRRAAGVDARRAAGVDERRASG